MTWTPECIAEVKRLRAQGLMYREIAAQLGMTKNQVGGFFARIDGTKETSRHKTRPKKSTDHGNWDAKLFEPWTEFRARRVAERAQMQA